MHLLSTLEAATADVLAAVDLAQSPGEIVILSAADSELACLAAAQARLPEAAPSLRLANLLQLAHPLSVDLQVERVVAKARLVVVRLLGGRSYWPYGIEQVAAACRADGIALACLPGDDRADPELAELSTLPPDDLDRLWRYLCHGGIDNAEQMLRYAAHLLGHDVACVEPRPLPRAGLYHPDQPAPSLEETGRQAALVVFYRALVQSGDLAPIDALVRALEAEGLAAVGLYVTSLKDAEAAAVARSVLAVQRPAVVLNATAFAAGAGDPLADADAPVLQVILAGGSEPVWRDGARGLAPRDLAMHVALPELDGRIGACAVSFKAEDQRDPRTETALARHRPVADRVEHMARLAAAWARLRATPAAARRVGIVLANYPLRDGRLANGVGLDTPASCVAVLQALREAEYEVDADPEGWRRAGPAARRRPDQRAAGAGIAEGARLAAAGALPRAVRRPAGGSAATGDSAVGSARKRSACHGWRLRALGPAAGQYRRRAAARARLPHRSGRDLPRA